MPGCRLLLASAQACIHNIFDLARRRRTTKCNGDAYSDCTDALAPIRRATCLIARTRKLFRNSSKVPLTGRYDCPILPPTHDGHTAASKHKRGTEAKKSLPLRQTPNRLSSSAAQSAVDLHEAVLTQNNTSEPRGWIAVGSSDA
jgi:hypothetical protein